MVATIIGQVIPGKTWIKPKPDDFIVTEGYIPDGAPVLALNVEIGRGYQRVAFRCNENTKRPSTEMWYWYDIRNFLPVKPANKVLEFLTS